MKKSQFTEEQIVFALKQAELDTPVPEVCRLWCIDFVSDALFDGRRLGLLTCYRFLRAQVPWDTCGAHSFSGGL